MISAAILFSPTKQEPYMSFSITFLYSSLQECIPKCRRCGPMDKAPAYGAGDSRFESVQWYPYDTIVIRKVLELFDKKNKLIYSQRASESHSQQVFWAPQAIAAPHIKSCRNVSNNFTPKRSLERQQEKFCL